MTHHLPPPPADLLDGAALFLDFDGTLTELAPTPDAILIPAGLASLLQRLQRRLAGRLAIISGRSIADLDRHVPASDIAFSGSHGLEIRLAGGVRLPLEVPDAMPAIRARVQDFAAAHQGLLVEEKPAGVALHFRMAPEQAGGAEAFMEALAREADLIVQKGNMVVELRPRGADKGDALRTLMREAPFAGARPLFVGDDLTDEHAFAAARALGGHGILVGAARQTAADYRLPSVTAVAGWLEGVA